MKQNIILTLISTTLLTVSCGIARNSTAVNNAVEPDSLVAAPAPGQLWGKTYGDYVFHDDFYYYSNKTATFPLIRKPDHFGLVIEYDFKDIVINILTERGFTVVRDIGKRSFPLERSPYCYYLVVKGKGKIDDLPYVIFSNHMYDISGDILGIDPTFFIVTSGTAEDENRLMKYTKEHNVIFTDSRQTPYGTYYYFKCTNESSGNPTEMANWFLERGGFSKGHCDWRDATVTANETDSHHTPQRIMVMDQSTDFPHTGGERTIYTFSHKGWKITKVETRNPDAPDLKSIPLAPTDSYAGEWYSLTVPEEGNSLVIRTEPYSGRRYRELYVTMYAGNIGRKITVLQYPPGKYGEYLRYNDSYDVSRELIISGGNGEEDNIREMVADKMPSGGLGQWITFRKHNDEWYMDICKGVIVYDKVDEIDTGKMSMEPMNPDNFDLEEGIDVVKVMRWAVDFDKSGRREFIAVISPLNSPSVNTDYQILLYEDLTKEINKKGSNVQQVLLKYILTDVNQTDPMPMLAP